MWDLTHIIYLSLLLNYIWWNKELQTLVSTKFTQSAGVTQLVRQRPGENGLVAFRVGTLLEPSFFKGSRKKMAWTVIRNLQNLTWVISNPKAKWQFTILGRVYQVHLTETSPIHVVHRRCLTRWFTPAFCGLFKNKIWWHTWQHLITHLLSNLSNLALVIYSRPVQRGVNDKLKEWDQGRSARKGSVFVLSTSEDHLILCQKPSLTVNWIGQGWAPP